MQQTQQWETDTQGGGTGEKMEGKEETDWKEWQEKRGKREKENGKNGYINCGVCMHGIL